MYLITAKSIVIRCKFVNNEGVNSIKIVQDFENEIENNAIILNNEIKSVVIEDSSFEINSRSESSISLGYKSESNAPVYLKNCVFTGKQR